MRMDGEQSPSAPTMKIEVTRPFCIGGDRQETGAQIDVDERFGRELIHNGKAVRFVAPEKLPDDKPVRGKKEMKE